MGAAVALPLLAWAIHCRASACLLLGGVPSTSADASWQQLWCPGTVLHSSTVQRCSGWCRREGDAHRCLYCLGPAAVSTSCCGLWNCGHPSHMTDA
jgi:hypothetical protein